LLEKSTQNGKAQHPPLQQSNVEVPDMYLVTSSAVQSSYDLSSHLVETPVKTTEPKPPARRSLDKIMNDTSHDPTQPYYFYQALPHSYLSPLDIRILKVAFGSFSSFPSTVLPRLEVFSSGHVVDDDLRKRAKYLSHLPYGCEVAFLECDWTDIVPAEVLEKFQPDLERRRKKKREKDNREERDRLRAEREEDEKRWSAARRRRGGEDDMSVAKEMSLQDFAGPSSFDTVPHSEEDESHEGIGAPHNGPRLGFASLPQSSPPSSRTVWGTPLVAGSGPPPPPQQPVQRPPVDSGWLEDWEREVRAMDSTPQNKSSGTGSTGKKKFKKVTLMTNTGKRGA